MRHGFPDDDFEWSLSAREKKKRGGGGEATIAIKQCDKCFFVHRPAPACPNCGYVYEINYREIEEKEGDLGEIDVQRRRWAKKRELWSAKSLESLIELGKARGYKYPDQWAAKIWTARARKKERKRARGFI